MEKVSIVVPFLNAEKSIEKCINSLLKQTYQNIEIIIVNDLSKDKSKEIIEKKFLNNDKIKYYEVEEETIGVSNARNLGVEKCIGKYFIFVDVDDYIDENLITDLSKYINQDVDVVKYKTNIVNENGDILEKIDGPIFGKENGQEAFNKLCFKDVFVDSPCLYLMKKEIFTKNKLKFRRNTYHEDFGLMPLVIVNAKTVVSTNIYGYYYVQSNESIMRTNDYKKNIKKAYDKLTHYDNMLKSIEYLKEDTKENIKIFYTNAIILTINELQGKERKEFIKEIRKRKMEKNIKSRNIKQLVKRLVLNVNIELYLKLKG